MSELATIAELYTPSVNNEGRYVDSVPVNIHHGIRCSCGSNTVFKSRPSFTTHTTSRRHVEWLERINNDQRNYLAENIRLTEQITQQRRLVVSLSNQLEVIRTELRAEQTRAETIKAELDDTKNKLIQCLMNGPNNYTKGNKHD